MIRPRDGDGLAHRADPKGHVSEKGTRFSALHDALLQKESIDPKSGIPFGSDALVSMTITSVHDDHLRQTCRSKSSTRIVILRTETELRLIQLVYCMVRTTSPSHQWLERGAHSRKGG
ncbi:hypothetical protein AA309_11895 [Microvirga vignae]|uniref:Uncharacterized protein n=1 Tax=Microvirga vignae TaxID=1225564 RepID=A0A0H1RD01_9HYPH|nr:hypothetical protein AA309_11895 [Microvirga vignae]